MSLDLGAAGLHQRSLVGQPDLTFRMPPVVRLPCDSFSKSDTEVVGTHADNEAAPPPQIASGLASVESVPEAPSLESAAELGHVFVSEKKLKSLYCSYIVDSFIRYRYYTRGKFSPT